MFETPLLLLSLLVATPADTVLIDPGRSFIRSHRPVVRVVIAAPDSIHLTLTSRDPQFFTTRWLILRAEKHDSTAALAEIQSDSSSMDMRYSADRHTLWFLVTREQLIAWSHGTAPMYQIGRVAVALDGAARGRLAELAFRLSPRAAP